MATPLMVKAYVLVAAAAPTILTNGFAPVTVVLALAVKPATPAALMACTLENAELALWPAAVPVVEAPMETAVPVPTAMVRLLPVSAVAVIAAPAAVAVWPIWLAPTP